MQNTLWSNRPDSFRNASPRSPSLEKEIHILLSTFGFDGGTAFPFAMLWICPWISGLSTTQGSQVWSQISNYRNMYILNTCKLNISRKSSVHLEKGAILRTKKFDSIEFATMWCCTPREWDESFTRKGKKQSNRSEKKQNNSINSIHPGNSGKILVHDFTTQGGSTSFYQCKQVTGLCKWL